MTPARQLVEQGRGLFGELGRSPRVSFSTATPTGRRSPTSFISRTKPAALWRRTA